VAAPSFDPVVGLARVMAGYTRPWFVSGGWAIDLFVGRVTRDHEDVEVGAFLCDQHELRAHLAGWSLHRIRNDAWEPWAEGDEIELPEFQAQARSKADPLGQFDIFFNPLDGTDWLSRRHEGLRVPARDVAQLSAGRDREPPGIPYLAPEIQLLYKAKYHRPKDDQDFDVALPLLEARRRPWLAETLAKFHPSDPWLTRL
jgi:hypothetical protein